MDPIEMQETRLTAGYGKWGLSANLSRADDESEMQENVGKWYVYIATNDVDDPADDAAISQADLFALIGLLETGVSMPFAWQKVVRDKNPAPWWTPPE